MRCVKELNTTLDQGKITVEDNVDIRCLQTAEFQIFYRERQNDLLRA